MKQHRPTYQTRRDVSEWSSLGYTHNSIARRLNIHADTLRKHYPEELEVSMKVKTELVSHERWNQMLKHRFTFTNIMPKIKKFLRPP